MSRKERFYSEFSDRNIPRMLFSCTSVSLNGTGRRRVGIVRRSTSKEKKNDMQRQSGGDGTVYRTCPSRTVYVTLPRRTHVSER